MWPLRPVLAMFSKEMERPTSPLCGSCGVTLPGPARHCPQCGAATRSLPQPAVRREERFAPGTTLLRQYRVVEKLGQGGMGAVYRARDDVSGQEVAVKVLPAGLARDPHLRERFVQEAQALASLDHPAIVPLITFARDDDDHYLVMKYVAGRSLESELARRGALPIDVARDIFRALLEALAYAHERGVIHRDIKPANILLDDGGKVSLVDFGIARREASTRLTETGILMGTPQYMSPEQIQGRGAERHSDLYAAGLLLFEMLTGRPPFVSAEVFALLRQHVESPVPDPRRLRTDEIPAALLAVLEALLRKDPARRPASAQAALDLLDAPVTTTPHFADDDPLGAASARRVDTPLTVPREDRRGGEDTAALLRPFRRRRSPALALAALSLLVGGGAWLAITAEQTRFAEDDEPLASAPLPPPDPREAAFSLLLRSADEHLKSRAPKRALGVLDAALLERPDDKTAWLLMARALIEEKRGKDAVGWIERLDQREDLEPFERDLVENYRAHLPRSQRARRGKAEAGASPHVSPRGPPAQTTTVERDAPQKAERDSSGLEELAALEHAAARTKAQARGCYERWVLQNAPKRAGRVAFEVRFDVAGLVEQVTRRHNDLADFPELWPCLERLVSTWELSTQTRRARSFDYTWDLRPAP